jgi:hypothetical protein
LTNDEKSREGQVTKYFAKAKKKRENRGAKY